MLLQISNWVSMLCGHEHIKNVWAWLWVGQWAWPGGMDGISHHIPTAFSFPEILHATGVSTSTVLIQSLMHLRLSLVFIHVAIVCVNYFVKFTSNFVLIITLQKKIRCSVLTVELINAMVYFLLSADSYVNFVGYSGSRTNTPL